MGDEFPSASSDACLSPLLYSSTPKIAVYATGSWMRCFPCNKNSFCSFLRPYVKKSVHKHWESFPLVSCTHSCASADPPVVCAVVTLRITLNLYKARKIYRNVERSLCMNACILNRIPPFCVAFGSSFLSPFCL